MAKVVIDKQEWNPVYVPRQTWADWEEDQNLVTYVLDGIVEDWDALLDRFLFVQDILSKAAAEAEEK